MEEPFAFSEQRKRYSIYIAVKRVQADQAMAEKESINSPSSTLVSVVVPVFNGGEDFDRCLGAVNRSDWPDFECIVVDDASTDDLAAEIAERHGARLVRLQKRCGPALARNEGVKNARGEVIFFTDADVVLHPDAISEAIKAFKSDPDLAAVFGSYDDSPGHGSFLSRYRNLYHHWNHQVGNEEASTFWTGCGAIRRDIFVELGGFSSDYARPSIEDIELGYRLREAGYRIRLLKTMLGTHLKQWKFWDMIRTDIFRRGKPWTELLLRFRSAPPDLNLNSRARIATTSAALLLLVLVLLAFSWLPVSWALLPVLLIAVIVWAQSGFYRLLARTDGVSFAIAVVPFQVLFFMGGALSVPLGYLAWIRGGRRDSSPGNKNENS
jgi:GT2 family glycosyltransferase